MKHFLLLMFFSAFLMRGEKAIARSFKSAPPSAFVPAGFVPDAFVPDAFVPDAFVPADFPAAPIVDTVPRLIRAAKFTADTGAVVVASTDTAAGYELDSIGLGDRVDYELWVPFPDTYVASFRVATAGAGASFLVVNYSTGQVLDTVVLPATGGLGAWQTVTVPLTLPYGYADLRIVGNAAPLFALNWIDIAMPVPPPVGQAAAVPGIVQAENYVSMYGVRTQATTDIGHGLNVGWIDYGDWMNYYVNIPSPGTYTLSFRVSTPNDHALFLVSDLTDQRQLMLMGVPNTGGFQNWTTITTYVYFPDAGPQVLQLRSTNWDIWNINWLYVQPGFPIDGAYQGLVEGSSYVYQNGVQLQWTADSAYGNNVYNVGWIDLNDWMNYYIYAPQAGAYTASFRVATPYDDASFQVVNNDGSVLATVEVPNTGGFQNWTTVKVPVNLAAGRDTVWVVSTSWNIWNFHWMDFEPDTVSTSSLSGSAVAGVATSMDSAFAASTLLWPNPVTEAFTIQLNDASSGNMLVQVIDGSGALRLEMNGVKTSGISQLTVPASTLLKGVYFVRIVVGDRVQVRKVLKL